MSVKLQHFVICLMCLGYVSSLTLFILICQSSHVGMHSPGRGPGGDDDVDLAKAKHVLA